MVVGDVFLTYEPQELMTVGWGGEINLSGKTKATALESSQTNEALSNVSFMFCIRRKGF